MANPFETEMQYPDYAAIQRKRKMADMLLQQGGSPLEGQMVSGHYVSPGIAGALAKALMIYKGGEAGQEADAEIQSLAEQLRGKKESWLGEMPKATDNTSMAGPAIPNKPTAEDYMAWALKGQSIDPQAAQMGMTSANMALNRDAQSQARADRAAEAELQRELQRELAEEQMRLRRELAAQQKGGQAYYTPVPTAQGYQSFNNRTGKWEILPGQGGAPVLPAAQDPSLQGQIAGSKAGSTVAAKGEAEAIIELPKVVAQGEEAVKLVDDLLKAPGFKQAVGGSRMLGVQKIPGTDAYDFDVRLNQLKGKQFLAAFETLKGGGQITEVEGKKATEAIARMDAASTEKEFTNAAREFQDIIKQGVDRAKAKAGGTSATPAAPKRIRFDAQGNMIQ